jgi:hypothetical protein
MSGLERAAPKKHKLVLTFEAAEHTAIGDDTYLLFSVGAPPTRAWQRKLCLTNGLELTYGQVIALGGDFYGIPGQPISDGKGPDECVQRFKNAFDSLARLDASREEVGKILEVTQREITAVKQAIKDGKQPHEAYDALGLSLSLEWNRITGGGSAVSTWLSSWVSKDLAWLPQGRYLKLAENNFDHFGESALLAYAAGHTAALQQALVAREETGTAQVKALEMAYAMNGFADHFLTDLFSAGHLRVPRKKLAELVTSVPLGPGVLGSLISKFMHDEDSRFGLKVRNAEQTEWHAYGDALLFDDIDSDNLQQVRLAVQESANEIFGTFCSGEVPPDFRALRYVPDLKYLNDSQNPAKNFSPLFKMDGDKVLCRKDLNDLNDHNWTDAWWGWHTYELLKHYHPEI